MQNDINIIKGSKAIGAEFGFSEDTVCRLLRGAWASLVSTGVIWKAGRTSSWRIFRKDLPLLRQALLSNTEAA